MISPFDIRTVLLAKHAQHVVVIHFPIALFITGVALDLLSRGRLASQFATAAYLNISIAAAMVIPAILTGVLAWQFALDGKRLKGLLLFHMVSAVIASLLMLSSWWVHWQSRKSSPPVPPLIRMALELLGVLAIGLAAHLGGFLTGVNS